MKHTLPPLLPHERVLRVGLALAVCVALGLVAFVKPQWRSLVPSLPCGFHSLTGLPCALCGGTRATRAILQGDFNTANTLNPLAYVALLAAFVLIVILLIEAMRGRRSADWAARVRRHAKWAPVALLLLVAWWIPHVLLALQSNNTNLIDLRNPIAARLKSALDER